MRPGPRALARTGARLRHPRRCSKPSTALEPWGRVPEPALSSPAPRILRTPLPAAYRTHPER